MEDQVKDNALGTEKVSRLILKYSVPSIIAMVIAAVYNLVDQLFIGNYVGSLGNAATNMVFPLTTVCVGLALLFGTGGAASFNLALGRGEKDKPAHFVGNSLVLLVISGVLLLLFTEIFMRPLLGAFGTPDEVMPYAVDYLRITSIGFPFLILMTGGGHLIRADGSPRIAMLCNVLGAGLNIVLDAIFVPVLGWGMKGAALATIIGQIISGIIVIVYMFHFKTVPFKAEHLRPTGQYIRELTVIGTPPFFNQICMMVVQVVLNRSLSYYGALSVYGATIPLACAGIIMKIYQIFFNVVIGLAQGAQPIESFNYGARKYARVRETYLKVLIVGFVICLAGFIIFRIFPRQLLELFGENTEEYFEFGVMFFRLFTLGTIFNFMQPLTSNFFTAIGKPRKGVFLSLTRQMIYFLPLIIILPLLWGLQGLLYTEPIADAAAFITAVIMAVMEWRTLKRMEAEELIPTTQ